MSHEKIFNFHSFPIRPVGVRRIFAHINEERFDFTGYYTILVTELLPRQNEIVLKILQAFWSLYITNVHVLTATTSEATAMLWTYYPFSPNHCEEVKPMLQNFFINDSFVLRNVEMFPDKLRNFYKCPLTLSTYNLEPYMMLTSQPNGSYYTDGIDGITFRVFSQQLNFTPIVRMSSKNLVRRITVKKHQTQNNTKLPRSLEMVNFYRVEWRTHNYQILVAARR